LLSQGMKGTVAMDFCAFIRSRKLVVGDGAMGTQLMSRGLEPGLCGESWNLDRPKEIEDIQRSYVDAGADYLLTNTFGGNPIALRRHNLEERTEQINAAAVEIARRAARGKAAVLGDIGPTGQMLLPVGELTQDQAREAFRRQASALAAAGADAIMAETFDSAEELRLALSAARQVCGLPLIASMKFQREQSGRYRSMMGQGPEQLVCVAEEVQCAAVGSNCGQGIDTMPALVEQIAALTDLPIIVQPNAGMPELVQGKTVYRQDPRVFERFVPALYEAGARIIGGCCGTNAEHIRVIRRFADSL